MFSVCMPPDIGVMFCLFMLFVVIAVLCGDTHACYAYCYDGPYVIINCLSEVNCAIAHLGARQCLYTGVHNHTKSPGA